MSDDDLSPLTHEALSDYIRRYQAYHAARLAEMLAPYDPASSYHVQSQIEHAAKHGMSSLQPLMFKAKLTDDRDESANDT
jgi:hypothetical protein